MKQEGIKTELVAVDDSDLESVAGGWFLLHRLLDRLEGYSNGSYGGYSKPSASESYHAPPKLGIPSSHY